MKLISFICPLFCIIIFHTSLFCQTNNKLWTVGLTYQPFKYWAYNKAESNYMWDQKTLKIRDFNGKAYGIFLGYNLNDNIDLKVELTYSKQTQKYKFSSYSEQVDSLSTIYFYGDDVINTFNEIKMPILFGISQELVYKSNFKIGAYLGPQISYLQNYSLEYIQHPEIDIIGPPPTYLKIDSYFDEDSIINYVRYNSGKVYQADLGYNGDSLKISERELPKAFRDITIGLVGGLELSKELFDVLTLRLGGRFEYDVTRMEISNNRAVSVHYDETYYKRPRTFTHQVRAGLSFSIGYKF